MQTLLVRPNGTAEWGGARFPCAVGKNGVTREKREGDNATPSGNFPIRHVYYRADKIAQPQSAFSTTALQENDAWCDDGALREYNTFVNLPFHGSHERLWRDDHLYDIVVVLGYNDDPAIPGKGSAIFLHVARPEYTGTAGCIAMSEKDLRTVLSESTAETRVRVEI